MRNRSKRVRIANHSLLNGKKLSKDRMEAIGNRTVETVVQKENREWLEWQQKVVREELKELSF